MFKIKNLLPLIAIAGVLFILPACGKKKSNGNGKGKASMQRRDYRRKNSKKSGSNKKSRRRRSFLFRK